MGFVLAVARGVLISINLVLVRKVPSFGPLNLVRSSIRLEVFRIALMFLTYELYKYIYEHV